MGEGADWALGRGIVRAGLLMDVGWFGGMICLYLLVLLGTDVIVGRYTAHLEREFISVRRGN